MDNERFLELDRSGKGLTEEEWKQGYHWCLEWDDMLVGPGQDEALFCSCDHPKIEEWKQSEEGKRMRKDLDERLDKHNDAWDEMMPPENKGKSKEQPDGCKEEDQEKNGEENK